jgi:hypothetical protein
MLQRCYTYVTKMLQRCYRYSCCSSDLLPRCAHTEMLQRCYRDVTYMLQRCYKDVTDIRALIDLLPRCAHREQPLLVGNVPPSSASPPADHRPCVSREPPAASCSCGNKDMLGSDREGSGLVCWYVLICSESREHRAESTEHRAERRRREQKAESREQRAESREQRAESREQRAENREQRADRCLLHDVTQFVASEIRERGGGSVSQTHILLCTPPTTIIFFSRCIATDLRCLCGVLLCVSVSGERGAREQNRGHEEQ